MEVQLLAVSPARELRKPESPVCPGLGFRSGSAAEESGMVTVRARSRVLQQRLCYQKLLRCGAAPERLRHSCVVGPVEPLPARPAQWSLGSSESFAENPWVAVSV